MKAKGKSLLWQGRLKRLLLRTSQAAAHSRKLTASLKRKILLETGRELLKASRFILKENQKDLRRGIREGLSSALCDRLRLTPKRIRQIAEGVRAVARLEEPVGKVLKQWHRPNGLRIFRVSVPIGVILIIYESRPNVTVECASLCLKSGNAVILRGGREAYHSNRAFVSIFKRVLRKHRLAEGLVSFVETTDRKAVDFLLQRDQDIDLVIPRGGESLIRKVVEASRIPVIKHYQGICHVYVDRDADLKKAVAIAYNAKMQRPGVCNAMETLLVHRKIASPLLCILGDKLRRNGCEIRADHATRKILPWARPAREGDFGHEFLEKILAVKIVKDAGEAIRHIQKYGSGHTEAIVTRNRRTAKLFVADVDASSVMVNASTRFADGFEYGLGAEIGISTDKIHARGPMGLDGLTSYKYVVKGNGQIRS